MFFPLSNGNSLWSIDYTFDHFCFLNSANLFNYKQLALTSNIHVMRVTCITAYSKAQVRKSPGKSRAQESMHYYFTNRIQRYTYSPWIPSPFCAHVRIQIVFFYSSMLKLKLNQDLKAQLIRRVQFSLFKCLNGFRSCQKCPQNSFGQIICVWYWFQVFSFDEFEYFETVWGLISASLFTRWCLWVYIP